MNDTADPSPNHPQGPSSAKEYPQRTFTPPPGATEVFLVRHGQSAAFRVDTPFELVEGQGDPPLSPLGQWQAERVAERMASEQVDAIYVTTLRRTAQTAAPLAARLSLGPQVERDLREVHLGEWEGGVFRKMAAEQDPAIRSMHEAQDWGVVPGAESSAALRARVRAAVERIHQHHPDQRVVAVSHGGAIGAMIAEATGARSLAFVGADNASISHLVVLGDHWVVRRFNDTGHLAGELSAVPEPVT